LTLRIHGSTITYRVGHLFCGVGAGAKGFGMARPSVRGVHARFVCAGGVDIDAGAIDNFGRLTGSKGTVLDLFDREQYQAWHGKEPPAGWREATPADIRRAHGDRPLDVMFLSAPCKGFSGLLSASQGATDKYQALNRLTLRGVWLSLEAFKDAPVRVYLFENVPRIATRGRKLLDQIIALFKAYGYVVSESEHDCGEIGGLGQSRKRFLLVARRIESVPNFIYEPEKKRLRGVGEIIGRLPLPGDPVAGAMHRVPMLQWKTWVRLAFVPAGKDWRALNNLVVEQGVLRDFGILPDQALRDNALGVNGWDDTAPLITGARAPGQGRFSVADPRPAQAPQNSTYGVRAWSKPTGTAPGRSTSSNGAHSVADPRPTQANQGYHQYGVKGWEHTASTVIAQAGPGSGPHSVSDPRILGKPRFNNTFRIVPFDQPSPAVAGPGGPAGGHAVADPRAPNRETYSSRKYRVTPYGESSRTVIAASTTGDGAFAVADPRSGYGPNTHHNILKVTPFDQPGGTVSSATHPAAGALSVADPRPVCLNADSREGYATQGHYGVQPWDEASNAIPAFAKNNNGKWSVADPRDMPVIEIEALPEPAERLVARIISLDNTWHRPFTTLELAALQSLFDPDEVFGQDPESEAWIRRADFDLVGASDAGRREWIGNAVPSEAARGMAEEVGEALLLADLGETFTLSSKSIWCRPLAFALAVDPVQHIFEETI
jgi:site-specific DNA-cytosine methylase